MFAALKSRRDMLEEALRKRTEELRALCIKEGVSAASNHGKKPYVSFVFIANDAQIIKKRETGHDDIYLLFQELTGELPPETPQKPGEALPQIRRRVGTEYSLSPQILNRDKAQVTKAFIAAFIAKPTFMLAAAELILYVFVIIRKKI